MIQANYSTRLYMTYGTRVYIVWMTHDGTQPSTNYTVQ